MTILHAPAPGVAKPLDALAEALGADLGPRQGIAIMPVQGRDADTPELVLVAACAGTIKAVDENGYVLEPLEVSPPLPSCREVVVRIVGGTEVKRNILVHDEDEVESGQQVMRWKADKETLPAYLLEIVDPEGEVLCELMESEVHAAEPLLEIMGPRGEELAPVVAIEPDGSVTPDDTQEASQLVADGEAPGQVTAEPKVRQAAQTAQDSPRSQGSSAARR